MTSYSKLCYNRSEKTPVHIHKFKVFYLYAQNKFENQYLRFLGCILFLMRGGAVFGSYKITRYSTEL